ncbi:MAG: glycosyltransferase family 4 protein [Kiritimatiellia bacterium]|jgi:glycosyltransferase involved in cell wall biosynthesis
MHIVQILPALNQGGVERGTVELSRELVQLGHRSTVIASGGKLAEQIIADGGKLITMDVRSKNPISALLRVSQLRTILRGLNPTVVHYRSRVPGWLFVMANRSLKLPCVSTVHGFNSVNAYSRVMTFGERVICPGSGVVEYIRQHYGVPEWKIRLIPRGVDPTHFDPQRIDHNFIREFQQRHGLQGAYVVLGVGRITPLKGYDVLIRAVAKAWERVPQIKCVIVGSVDPSRVAYANSLRQLVRELRVEEQVIFAGGESRMAEIYALGDVLTSNNAAKPEAFGRTMAEALAMNTLVVASRFGGALDIVREGENGRLYEPGNVQALAEILAELPHIKFNGLREDALRCFGLQQMVEKTVAVYGELAGAT